MTSSLSVPVTAKIRILPDERRTMELVKAIEDSGCQLLTVHGRTKEQNKIHVGQADWTMIRKIKETLSIPVVANGGIETYADYQRCLEETGADAVMSSEGKLRYCGNNLYIHRFCQLYGLRIVKLLLTVTAHAPSAPPSSHLITTKQDSWRILASSSLHQTASNLLATI